MMLMCDLNTGEQDGELASVRQHESLGGAERRRGFRIRQNRPIKIFEPTSHRYFGGQTRDVSATGLKVELPLSMPVLPGNTIDIHVGLSDRGEALANRRSMIH